ncbi:unnamed protein product [Paramecium pentaurelia]|uniref:WD40-repeat-containing domain n=1 Tax=Paramecium pentaurelia TaxID=43138 RepID=A0A8S1U2U9_9CILI|nr:unnamed protein product [Paramecium pentaurelia]
MIQNCELVCFQNHNKPVCSVIVEKCVKKDERLLCKECLKNFDQKINIKGLSKIKEMIEKKLLENNEKKQYFLSSKIQEIEQLTNDLNQLKQKLIITFDLILGDLKNCIDHLAKEQQINNPYRLIDELEKLLNQGSYENEFMQFIDYIISQNNNGIKKVLSKISQLTDIYKEANNRIKNSFKKIIKIPQTEIQMNLINKEIKQNKNCYAIAFNQNGQIMASGCGKDIKLWNFNNGKLKEIQTLSSHKQDVSCLIFSKLSDNFVSGSFDSTIKIWKQFKGQEWKSLQSKEDYNPIFCLILQKNEKVLISGSEYYSINVWDIDFELNRLNLSYSLIKHTQSVCSLSLNESETFLVSCGNDQQIIVWMREQNNQWGFKQIVTQSIKEIGTKICFIKENQFIWICGNQNGKDCICFFELQNEKFQEQFNQQINLISNNQESDQNLFPIIFNKEKKIIFLRHKFNIYILSQQFHNKYKIASTLKFDNYLIQGSMTNDAEFQVVWEKSNSSYLIYQINQKQ